jgi:ParB-like chromosome segregation protein Spo0J
MAVTLLGEITRTKTLWKALPENILIEAELNGRHEHTEVESLAADIAIHGQNTPCLIRKNAAGQPVLVYGHRRWRAVQLLNSRKGPGEQKIELECNYEALTDEEALIAAITENRFRKDVTPMDDCYNIQKLKKLNKASDEQIAVIYFPEATTPEAKAEALRWVKNRAALVELATEAADGVRKGEIKVTAAVELTKLSKDQQRVAIEQSKSTVGGKTRIKVKDVKAAAKPPKSAPRPAAKANQPDPDDVPFDTPVILAPLPSNPVLAAAETMARALDVWRTDATQQAEGKLITAHNAYRKLVPLQQADKAA